MTNHATDAAELTAAEAAEAIYHEVDCIEADFNRKEVERVLALYFEKVKEAATAELRAEVLMLRTALENVKKHQELSGGKLAKQGTTWNIADIALRTPTHPERGE